MEIITTSEKETQEFAQNFAKSLKSGDILALEGELGSGKTAFTKGIALALGISDVVTSPTFVVVKEYQIPDNRILKTDDRKLIHIDCYRIGERDADSIGLNEYLESSDNLTIIEWAENIKSILPKRTKYIKFKNFGKDRRKITVV